MESDGKSMKQSGNPGQ